MREDIDQEQFRQRLLERRKELQDGQREIGPVELDQSRIGRLTRMDAMQQQAMEQASARLNSIELQRIRKALELLDEGEYGYCRVCDEEIAKGRLEFDPAALLCIDCARAGER